tara:strand:- start:194 stop:451 length:258 start_codon:yes stop_codon:yes gene_type:complete
MELYEKLLQRIDSDKPIYCNQTFAKELETIANEHHQEEVKGLILNNVSNQRELLIDGFIETIEKEFSDQNWTYLEYVKERYLGNL